MRRVPLWLALCGTADFVVYVDEKFDHLSQVRQMARELRDVTDLVKLQVQEEPQNRNTTSDNFPRVLQRYFVAPLAFQDALHTKIELMLPVGSISDVVACRNPKCVDDVLENGVGVFAEVARDQEALAARLAVLSDAFARVRLGVGGDPEDWKVVTAAEGGKDAEDVGPHRPWHKLAAGIQLTARKWITRGPRIHEKENDYAEEGAVHARFWVKLGLFLATIPLIAWGVYHLMNFFTRPKAIAAPLLADVRLEGERVVNSKFEGRQITEYSHLNVP